MFNRLVLWFSVDVCLHHTPSYFIILHHTSSYSIILHHISLSGPTMTESWQVSRASTLTLFLCDGGSSCVNGALCNVTFSERTQTVEWSQTEIWILEKQTESTNMTDENMKTRFYIKWSSAIVSSAASLTSFCRLPPAFSFMLKLNSVMTD